MSYATWFFDVGVKTFPIKVRGKEPACRSWDDFAATRIEVAAFENYGVVLGAFGVADSDSPESEAWAQANLPETPFMVRTGRGWHRYYRLIADAPHYIHRDGVTIEFRHAGQYVVGPGSIHPSGAVYTPNEWSWAADDVPFFPVKSFAWDDRPDGERGSASGNPLVLPNAVIEGERHELLFKLMRSLQARGVTNVEQLLVVLRIENDEKCRPPLPRAELERYIRRVVAYKDASGFARADESSGIALASALFEMGVSLAAANAAGKAVQPDYDPGETVDAPDFATNVEPPADPPEVPHATAPNIKPTIITPIPMDVVDVDSLDIVDDPRDSADLETVDDERSTSDEVV